MPGTNTGVQTLLRYEDKARAEKRGLWALRSYVTLDANNLPALWDRLGRFAIVTGGVQDVAQVGDTVFVNFGENWRQDFTIEISKKTSALFEDAQSSLSSLRGQLVEVRGWLDRKAGPRILLLSPDHLRLIDQDDDFSEETPQ